MKSQHAELMRYIINGLVATAVHYGVLTFNLHVLDMPSAGAANLVAAIFGITVSFLGSRYFVFNKTEGAILSQALKFSGLYGAIAVLHGSVLLVWTDWLGFDYRVGFLIATAFQVSLSYVGNKKLVFNV
ncbi:MAG TPA: GtrA family protein [Methylotenera sp.]|jgi:putative flippase GtrA